MLGVSLVLKHCDPENPLWAKACSLFKNCIGLIQGCVLRKEICSKNLRQLMNHSEPKVSGVVAANLWGIKDEAKIPDDLYECWKQAIVRHTDEEQEYILERIFPKHPDIAYEWIAWRLDGIRDGTRSFWFGSRYDRVLPTAIRLLTREQRRVLIEKMPKTSSVAELVRSLIGRDMELFTYLLDREDLEGVRLDPLRIDVGSGLHAENIVTDFDEGWQKMAIAAMEKGFSPENIFSATQSGGYCWSGPMSSMFAARLSPFEKLLIHTDERIQRVGKIGVDHFSKLLDAQLRGERRAAIRGGDA